jgi:hypothetical protein
LVRRRSPQGVDIPQVGEVITLWKKHTTRALERLPAAGTASDGGTRNK